MRYRYLSTNSFVKATYENVSSLRTDYGLVKLMRKAKTDEPEYSAFDPYVVFAVIKLGEGERLVKD